MKAHSDALFPEDGRFVVVALDHGQLFGQLYDRLQDPRRLLEAAVDGGADAVISSFGIVKAYRSMLGGGIKVILRLDGGPTRYLEQWPRYTEWQQLYDLEAAVAIGADAVIVMVFFGSPVETENARILASLATQAQSCGIPVVAEVIPCAGPTIPDPFAPRVVADAVRYCFELGADFVKTTYTGTAESFRHVTNGSPVPVGILGGRHAGTLRELLLTAEGSIEGGGAGVFFGRNVWQRANPAETLRALGRIIHDGDSAEEALAASAEGS